MLRSIFALHSKLSQTESRVTLAENNKKRKKDRKMLREKIEKKKKKPNEISVCISIQRIQ